MKKLLYTLLAVSIIFSACKKEEEDDTPNSPFVGYWSGSRIKHLGTAGFFTV